MAGAPLVSGNDLSQWNSVPLSWSKQRYYSRRLDELSRSGTKHAFTAIKRSTKGWHMVNLVIRGLPLFIVSFVTIICVVSNKTPEHVCDASQQAKSHHLPFPVFVTGSKTPLELSIALTSQVRASSQGIRKRVDLRCSEFAIACQLGA